MRNLFSRRYVLPLAAICFADGIAVGAGMGVPFFPILLGFAAGWILPGLVAPAAADDRRLLRLSAAAGALPCSVTLLLMLAVWGPVAAMLFDPAADIANFGIPLILFEPTASFIGWIVLMIAVSPALQLMATLSAAYVRVAWRPPAAALHEVS
jgi:hypothetical protein